jgi:RNA polymerase sigma-70 factor (ECF subfamily)
MLPTAANGAPAVGMYQRQADGSYQAAGVSVMAVDGEQVSAITSFLDPRLNEKFGLPATLP